MFNKFLLSILVIIFTACGSQQTSLPTATAIVETQTGTISTGELGEVRFRTTILEGKQGELTKTGIVITSYSATQFVIYGHICYQENGSPIYNSINEASGGIRPGSSLELSLFSNDEVGECDGTLILVFYDKNGKEEKFTIPVTVVVK
ncbi:MAG TPA: hypothetical protein VFI61_04155 [Patescibacteria group bacterium]|nr:hypothetical protein [Patescibacteria group bacterium]